MTLRGSGNLENASLPPLSADGGLDPRQFRLPAGEVAGTLDNDGKKFSVTVRVEDEAVSEIPAIAYSWFDPTEEAYRTTRSKPIALRVMPARIVSATDVVTAAKKTPDPAAVPAAPQNGSRPNEVPAAPARGRVFTERRGPVPGT